MNPEEKIKLTDIIDKYAKLSADIQAKRWEQKELAESAWEKCGVEKSVVKQLAKEQAFDDVKKEKLRQHEESLHQCRTLLGLLLDTPLGQAAVSAEESSFDAGGLQHGNGKPAKARGKKKQPATVFAAAH